jgi:hypothetical protein
LRTDCPLSEQATRRASRSLAGRLFVIVILAGGLFGAVWNTTDSVRSQLPPASVQPSPAMEPDRTAESPEDMGCEEPIYTV